MRRKHLIVTSAIVIALAVGAYWGRERIQDATLIPRCEFQGATAAYELAPDQASNAATIAAVAIRRGLPKRAITVALAAALQESKLRTLDYGDRDSVGLFQQRPSQGWGPRSSLLDPVYATNRFFSALNRNIGWQGQSIADAAQSVQRSAAGSAYAGWEDEARVVSEILSSDPFAMTCYLHRYGTPAAESKSRLVMEFVHVFGMAHAVSEDSAGLRINVTSAQNPRIAAWLVANADRFDISSVEAIGHKWSRRGWAKSSYTQAEIKVRLR